MAGEIAKKHINFKGINCTGIHKITECIASVSKFMTSLFSTMNEDLEKKMLINQ